MDISSEAILQAQHLANARTRFTVAQAEDFDPGGTFDVIVFNQCLYYMAKPAAILMRYQKFLAPKGRLIVCMYDTPRTRAAWRDVKRVMRVEDEIATIQNNGRSTTALLEPR